MRHMSREMAVRPASLEASSIKKAIEEAFVQLGYLKPASSQEYAITEFVLGHDVFVCLPTGEGKVTLLLYAKPGIRSPARLLRLAL